MAAVVLPTLTLAAVFPPSFFGLVDDDFAIVGDFSYVIYISEVLNAQVSTNCGGDRLIH